MEFLIKNVKMFENGILKKSDVAVKDGVIADVSDEISPLSFSVVYDFNNFVLFPGLADVHVHLREPGFSYKETIKTGTLASAHGGYTDICSMPNLKPVPDSAEHLKQQTGIIKADAAVNVYPYASITVGQMGEKLSDMEEMAKDAIAFSDDGRGVQSEEMMRSAMEKAKSLGKMIVAHCEDNSLLHGGYIHDGEYARKNGHKGICSESEWGQIERDLRLAEKVGCAYHVCHISCKESVEVIRAAKARGVDVTCETAPHYLALNDGMLRNEGRFKMNPPIRSETDRLALIEGIADGTIDMIATDHAPHSKEEKSGGLKNSLNGIVGIETAFPVLYTELVKTGIISLERLIDLMSVNPCRRFKIDTEVKKGSTAKFTVFDLEEKYTIDPEEFLSMGKSTPFEGKEVYGRCIMTVCGDNIPWQDERVKKG